MKVTQRVFDEAVILFDRIDALREGMKRPGLSLSEKLEMKRHIEQLNRERRLLLGLSPTE